MLARWQDSEEGNVGVFEKLSKWFHGPADLGEPSGPEQKESYNTSIDQFQNQKLSTVPFGKTSERVEL